MAIHSMRNLAGPIEMFSNEKHPDEAQGSEFKGTNIKQIKELKEFKEHK